MKMSRKNQKGHCIWVPQKISAKCTYIDFFAKYYMILKSKILFLMLKENNSQTYSSCFDDVMTFYLQFCLSLD